MFGKLQTLIMDIKHFFGNLKQSTLRMKFNVFYVGLDGDPHTRELRSWPTSILTVSFILTFTLLYPEFYQLGKAS